MSKTSRSSRRPGASLPPVGTTFRLIALLAVILAMVGLSPLRASGQEDPNQEPEDGSDVQVEQAVTDAVAAGTSDFWVVMEAEADLGGAGAIDDWAERGQHVYDQLTATAESSQADLVAELTARAADFESFWIVNALYVRDGDQATLDVVTEQPGVASVQAPTEYEVPEPIVEPDDPRIQALEWGVANVRADQVWTDFGVRGEGITVANIDTGVDHLHPALVNQYRGNNGDGTFDHNYNWFDPGGDFCADAPCDSDIHGTHVMGTMVGDDGAGNQVGVAPGANWMAAMGCPFGGCPDFDLLTSAEFVMAPTDLDGLNPRPDLRAHVVNNSWGANNGPFEDPFFSEAVDAWTAAGVFGAFANGNDGFSGCDSAGSPADDVDAWGVGAYDINNVIAGFSSRGPAGEPPDEYPRPNISAPGVDVRSSVPGGDYGFLSGTSMATPHLAGAVALMWSASPAVFSDIDGTRQILDDSAVDTEDLSCGGDADDNNVYGEGRLDAFTAVDLTPRGPTGTLVGTVTEDGTGTPVVGATVGLTVEGRPRTTRTGPDGTYQMRVPVSTYEVTASAVGYRDATGDAEILEDQETTLDFSLAALPRVSGTVTNANDDLPVEGALVTATSEDGAVVSAETGPDGTYELLLEIGTWTVTFEAEGYATVTEEVTFDSDGQRVTLDVALRAGVASIDPTSIDEILVEGEERTTDVTLSNTGTAPFDWEAFESGGGTVNGSLAWIDRATEAETTAAAQDQRDAAAPGAIDPATAVGPSAAEWTPDVVDPQQASILVYADDWIHPAPNTFVDQALQRLGLAYTAFYEGNFAGFESALATGDWDVVIFANDNYWPSDSTLTAMNDYVLGGGRLAAHSWVLDAFASHSLWDTLGISYVSDDFDPPDPITWWDDQHPLFSDPEQVPELTGRSPGIHFLPGQRVTASPDTEALGGYTEDPTANEAALVLGNDERTLFKGFMDVPNGVDLDADSVLDGIELWENAILGLEGGFVSDVPWLDVSPDSGTVDEDDSQNLEVTVDTTGLAPGEYAARVVVRTTAVRQPRLTIPIRLVVSAYRQGVNAGGGSYTDVSGDAWAADQEFDGSWGWEYQSTTPSIRRPIAGTQDDPLFQSARAGQHNYRFEGLPDGTYEIELELAEIQRRLPGERLFDVNADNTSLLVGYDIAEDVGLDTAVTHRFTVEVNDGVLRIRMLQRRGNGRPILNAVRITNRPDL